MGNLLSIIAIIPIKNFVNLTYETLIRFLVWTVVESPPPEMIFFVNSN